MIEVIQQQFKEEMTTGQKLNVARETLQIIALKILYEKKFFDQIAFVGGTSLRILYDLKRFSEDLDFSVIKRQKYDFDEIHKKMLKEFRLYGLPFEAKVKTDNTVHSLAMKFPGLLKDLGLSELPGQKLSIKLQVDTNPPHGWNLEQRIVNKIYLFTITHHDLPSLYATKLHACFYRRFTKGRDFYDFAWYLTKKIRPNFPLLNNAIQQTHKMEAGITEKSFKSFLIENIRRIDFKHVQKDVERFLEDKNELNLLDAKMIENTIESVYGEEKGTGP